MHNGWSIYFILENTQSKYRFRTKLKRKLEILENEEKKLQIFYEPGACDKKKKICMKRDYFNWISIGLCGKLYWFYGLFAFLSSKAQSWKLFLVARAKIFRESRNEQFQKGLRFRFKTFFEVIRGFKGINRALKMGEIRLQFLNLSLLKLQWVIIYFALVMKNSIWKI